MHYLLTRLTEHGRTDALLAQARRHWQQLVAEHDPQARPGLPRVAHEDGLPSSWAATFYMLPHAEQVLLGVCLAPLVAAVLRRGTRVYWLAH